MDPQAYGVRPRSVGEILRQTGSLYMTHFATIVGVAAAILVPAAAIQVGFFAVILDSDDLAAIFLLQLLGGVIGVATAAAALAGVTVATAQIVFNGKTSILEAFDYAMPRIVDTLKASYLLYVILGFLIWTVIGGPIAIFLAIAWLVTIQVVIIEGTGARVGLGRSWELTRGNRLRVLGTTILIGSISGVMLAFFLLPLFAVMLRAMLNESVNAVPGFAWVLVSLFWILGSVLVTPLQYLAWTLVYLDLRARDDARKVERPRDAFDASPAALAGMD
jgi:hypothetical protein